MEHDLELIIARLEIVEIEVCNILQNPGNIGNLSFSTSSYPGNIGSYDPYINPILEIVDRTIQYLLIILKTFFNDGACHKTCYRPNRHRLGA